MAADALTLRDIANMKGTGAPLASIVNNIDNSSTGCADDHSGSEIAFWRKAVGLVKGTVVPCAMISEDGEPCTRPGWTGSHVFQVEWINGEPHVDSNKTYLLPACSPAHNKKDDTRVFAVKMEYQHLFVKVGCSKKQDICPSPQLVKEVAANARKLYVTLNRPIAANTFKL